MLGISCKEQSLARDDQSLMCTTWHPAVCSRLTSHAVLLQGALEGLNGLLVHVRMRPMCLDLHVLGHIVLDQVGPEPDATCLVL